MDDLGLKKNEVIETHFFWIKKRESRIKNYDELRNVLATDGTHRRLPHLHQPHHTFFADSVVAAWHYSVLPQYLNMVTMKSVRLKNRKLNMKKNYRFAHATCANRFITAPMRISRIFRMKTFNA